LKLAKPPRPLADTPDDAALNRPPHPEATEFHQVAGAATMTGDKVSAQLEDGDDSDEELSEFQQSLVDLAKTLDVPDDSARMRVLRLARRIDDEHDAAVLVREVATKFVESE
jgi:hypothetical protein